MTAPGRPRPSRRSAEDAVVQAAWLYYHDGLNQTAIADYLEVSRATVVNWLQQAREPRKRLGRYQPATRQAYRSPVRRPGAVLPMG